MRIKWLLTDFALHLLQRIHAHGEAAYPEEGAGLLLGRLEADDTRVERLLEFANAREALRPPQPLPAHRRGCTCSGEMEAARLGLDVIGVFPLAPRSPQPPVRVRPRMGHALAVLRDHQRAGAGAVESRSWLLSEDRSEFYRRN